MTKKVFLAILLISLSGIALATSFTIDPADILAAWYKSRHWPMVSAIALLTGMIAATWKMGKLENETQAKMVSDLFKVAQYIVVFLMLLEFYKPIKAIAINVIGFAYDLASNFFDFILSLI